MKQKQMCNRIAVVGDAWGVPTVLAHLPSETVACIVCAALVAQPELEELAGKLGVPLLVQPRFNSLDYEAFSKDFAALQPDLLLCNSYSMILRPDVLATVSYNAINAHAALLPKNRGPNPIQWSIIRGEEQTGVTLHYMNDSLDSGDIVAQKAVNIAFTDTWDLVQAKVAEAINLIWEEQIGAILEGNNARTPQDESEAVENQRLNPDSPEIHFDTMSDLEIYNLIRAQVAPLGGAFVQHTDGSRTYFDSWISYESVIALRDNYTQS